MHALQVQFQINTKKEVKIKAVYEKGRDERERGGFSYPQEGEGDTPQKENVISEFCIIDKEKN